MPNNDFNDRPVLFVPCYPPPSGFGDDTGIDRPVPGGIPYYLCPGIQVDTPYRPGAPLSARVTVANWQGGNSASIAMVALWWSPPLSGTTVPDPSRFIGFATVPLPSHGARNTTAPMTATIPASAPSHICLLAKVWHALDMPPTTQIAGKAVEIADPVRDRHWAQHNLVAVAASAMQLLPFLATNPLAEETVCELLIQPVDFRKSMAFADREHTEPVQTNALFRLEGLPDGARPAGENGLRHRFYLRPGEARELVLSVEPGHELQPGAFSAFEVLQFNGGEPAGGFGIAIRASPA
ncbi:hypothetical protein [Massilia sp. Se16.2.3]|uniref:hypothetical protein n=1 Tax=Massilia sp. Se16.2.3 TaxID=2709303 RepID=UPI0016023442|nr:hypothetical protein [Massilia sp. Se16.2.3]QNB01219.1 hypothetical protein G4G31_24335 [Massilia sp. Se16.2.3]